MQPSVRRSSRNKRAPNRYDPSNPTKKPVEKIYAYSSNECDWLKALATIASELSTIDPIDQTVKYYSNKNIKVKKTGPNTLKFLDSEEEYDSCSEYNYSDFDSDDEYNYDSDSMEQSNHYIDHDNINQLMEFQTELLSAGDDQDKWMEIVEQNLAKWKK